MNLERKVKCRVDQRADLLQSDLKFHFAAVIDCPETGFTVFYEKS